MKDAISIFWFRRDLRLDDNVGFYQALKSSNKVMPIFIFDTDILNELPEEDARLSFIYETLKKMHQTLKSEYGSGIAMYHGKPKAIFETLCESYNVVSVFTNHDYEPYAKSRDTEIQSVLDQRQIPFRTFKDQVIFEKSEVAKDDGNPYVVYTPYKNKWKDLFNPSLHLLNYDTFSLFDQLYQKGDYPQIALSEMGFKTADFKVPEYTATPK
ncbi:MAG: deoxyribodipyrimidine photo-lyase, partial [Bacteroidota bacterium]